MTGVGTRTRAGATGVALRSGTRALAAWRPTPYTVAGTAFWLLLAVVAWHTPIASDFGQHASAVQRVRDHPWHPANPLLKEPGTDSPYYSPYIVALGLAARATGAAGWQMVRWCGPLNLAVLVAGVGAYARTLSTRRAAPVYALLAFTLLWGVEGKEWSGFCGVWSLTRGASYPSCFAVGLTFLLWAWTDRLARRGGTAWQYAGLGAAAGVLLLVHPITALAAAVGIAATVAARQHGWSRRVAGRWALAAAAAVAVAAAWPYFDVFSLAGDTTVDQVHRRLYTHPWQWYGLALAGVPALAWRAARTRLRDPLVLMFAADGAIAVYGWFSGHYTYGRVFALLLVPLQFGLAVELAAAPPWTRLRAALVPPAAVALCFALAAQIGSVVPQSWLPVATRHPARWPDYRWVADRVPVGDVVLTDESIPMHVLPAYGLYLVAPTWPDPSTPAADRDRRWSDTTAYFAPSTPPARRAAIAHTYGATWLLLPPTRLPPAPATLTATSPQTGEHLYHLTPPKEAKP
ncbi:hypothetical protein [Actinacidiphila bryophytorum]|uniref:Integral membrane protein n=2 Tax=Actinacidiphila bryophytorum TaxID=1436133 RepID=A0A9W4ED53_9ACTN|nr:hypothetical protein [Actinacidiphila bryophytorum]MBM9440419.1 hypothetical protein [Actinacidiphila bryophytorum]CAG7622786.1 conserved membrane hypothetical protein [Actinacidiphila bryophytorum]